MLLDVRRLNRYMSGPRWSAAQWAAAGDILAGTEQDLADALYGAVFEPFEHDEDVPIDRDGLVVTSWPVFALIAVDDVTATDATHAPGYQVVRHRLRRSGAPSTPGVAPIVGLNDPALIRYTPGGFAPGLLDGDPWTGRARVHYLAGWGPEPALVNAILEKASIRMENRHSDSMVVTGVTAQNAPPRPPKAWTADELAMLARYRNLGWGNR